MFLKVLGILFIILGAIIVFAAGFIVKKFGLDKDIKVNFEHVMDEEEMADFKFSKAVVNIKAWGMLAMLPGLILVIIAFR